MVATSDANTAAKVQFREGGNAMVVKRGGEVVIEDGGALTGKQLRHTARSVWFNLDNGAGTTIDDVIMRLPVAVTIIAARIVYVTRPPAPSPGAAQRSAPPLAAGKSSRLPTTRTARAWAAARR